MNRQSRQIGAARTMTYGWNSGPDNPRHGDAATDDPDQAHRHGDRNGQPGGDPASQPGRGPEAGRDHTTGPAGAPGDRETPGYAATWTSVAGTGAAPPSRWQPGYEPLGYRQRHAPDHQPAAVEQAPADEHARYRPPGYQGAGGSASHWLRGYEPPGYQERRPGQPGGEPAGGAGPGYERPGHDPEGDMQVARQPAQPLTGEPDYRTAAYRPPAKQRPAYDAPADVVTYGYSADPSAAAYQQQGSAFPVDAAVAYPDWTGQPEAEQPEFAPYGPPELSSLSSRRTARPKLSRGRRKRHTRMTRPAVLPADGAGAGCGSASVRCS